MRIGIFHKSRAVTSPIGRLLSALVFGLILLPLGALSGVTLAQAATVSCDLSYAATADENVEVVFHLSSETCILEPALTVGPFKGDLAIAFNAVGLDEKSVQNVGYYADSSGSSSGMSICQIGSFSTTIDQFCQSERTVNGSETTTAQWVFEGRSIRITVGYNVVNNGDFVITSASANFEANPSAPVLTSFTRKTPSQASTNDNALTFLATFNEDVTYVTADDFTVNGSTATIASVSQVTPSTYDIVVSGGNLSSFNGSVGLNVAASPFVLGQFGVELPNTEPATDDAYTVDNTAPTVTISGAPANVNTAPFTATFTFNEDVNNFDLADITAGLTNASASNFATSTAKRVFTALITPNGGVGITVGVNTSAAQDDAGNNNTAATDRTATLDSVGPTVEILGAPASHNGSTPFDVTAEFSEDVLNFVAGDVTVGNGAVSGFTAVDGHTYTVQITPTNRNKVTVDIAANVASDVAGNLNTAATQIIIAGTAIEDTSKIIGAFMENRATGIANAQPNIGGFITGDPLGSLNVDGNSENLTLNYAGSVTLNAANQSIDDSFGAVEKASRKGAIDLWAQVSGINASAGNADSKLWVGYFGSHTFLSDDLLLGALLQVDFAEEANKLAGSNVDGTGWMIGPYIAGKVTDQSIFYEARAAWGRSDNKITPFGTYTDSFDTERWMISGKLSGDFEMGTLTISPNVALSYFHETQLSYTDSLTNLIPSQTLTSGEIRFGPQISNKITLDDGTKLIPKGGLTGIYTYNASTTNTAQTLTLNQGDFRARLDFGLTLAMINGITIGTDIFYDGIGIKGYQAWGGQAKLTVPLQ